MVVFLAVLVAVAEEIVDMVVALFDDSLNQNVVPSDWLLSVIAVIFKKGKKSLAGNYRPVSLTCILCKCMEKLIRDHIVEHMRKNGLFSKFQYGFLSGRSVTLQLLYTMDRWTEALDKGEEVDVIYHGLLYLHGQTCCFKSQKLRGQPLSTYI